MERILKLPQSFYSKEQLPKALRINFSKMRIDFKQVLELGVKLVSLATVFLVLFQFISATFLFVSAAYLFMKIYFYIQSIFQMDFNLTMSIQEKDEFIDELWR